MPITVEENLGSQGNYDDNEENRSPLERKKVYYPNNIGYPIPCSKNQYEFVLMGSQNKQREALTAILKIFEEQRVRIKTLSFFNDQSPKQFVMDVVTDFSNARCTPADLALRLNKIKKFVKFGEYKGSNRTIFAEFLFPLTFFGTVRALAIDSDRFTRLFSHISEELGEVRAKRLLFEDGRSEGTEVVSTIREFLENGASDIGKRKELPGDALAEGGEEEKVAEDYIFQNARAFMRAAGWGTLSFSKMEGSDAYHITLWDPPTDADGGIVVGNYFLQGMIAGIIESVSSDGSRKLNLCVMKESYDSESRTLALYYVNKIVLEEEPRQQNEEGTPEIEPSRAEPINEKKLASPAIQIPIVSRTRSGLQIQSQQLPPPAVEETLNGVVTNSPEARMGEDGDNVPAVEAHEQVNLLIKSIEKIPKTNDPVAYEKEIIPVESPESIQGREEETEKSLENMSENTGGGERKKAQEKEVAQKAVPNRGGRKNGFRAVSAKKTGKATSRNTSAKSAEKDSRRTESEDNFWL